VAEVAQHFREPSSVVFGEAERGLRRAAAIAADDDGVGVWSPRGAGRGIRPCGAKGAGESERGEEGRKKGGASERFLLRSPS
jgi:hypothetical protein